MIGQGIGGADIELNLTYDKAGNLRTEGRDVGPASVIWTYTHDAWNRLVKIVNSAGPTKAEYEYNGLNWRIIKRLDPPGGAGGLDQQRMMYYSSNWQLCEERIDDESPFPTDPNDADIDRHVQYVAGVRYIDDVILHREDGDVDGTYDDTWYHLTDVQFSTVAIIDDAANLKERVTYDPYGSARHHRRADLDGDGDVDGADKTILENNWGNFGEGDLDRSGTVGVDDLLILLGNWGAALADGLISNSSSGGVDNQIGYDSYVFNAETRQYLARNRWYDTELGRWLQRDPAGYVDGMNLYEYVGGRPLINTDPTGLAVDDDEECCVCEDDPGKCSIKVVHAFTFNSNANNVQVIMQLGAKVTLEHADGEDVTGCHLRQDTHGMANYNVGISQPRTTWISRGPPIAEWRTKKDYAPDVPNGNYHGHWYQDAPGMNLTWGHPKAQGLDIITYWWQAQVWVIESPTVETWWGFQITGRRTDEPQEGSTFWSAIQRHPFSTLPGHDKSFKGWGNELGSDF